MGFGEISKKLSDIWKSLPDEEKQPYIEKSRLEQETINPVIDGNGSDGRRRMRIRVLCNI